MDDGRTAADRQTRVYPLTVPKVMQKPRPLQRKLRWISAVSVTRAVSFGIPRMTSRPRPSRTLDPDRTCSGASTRPFPRREQPSGPGSGRSCAIFDIRSGFRPTWRQTLSATPVKRLRFRLLPASSRQSPRLPSAPWRSARARHRVRDRPTDPHPR